MLHIFPARQGTVLKPLDMHHHQFTSFIFLIGSLVLQSGAAGLTHTNLQNASSIPYMSYRTSAALTTDIPFVHVRSRWHVSTLTKFYRSALYEVARLICILQFMEFARAGDTGARPLKSPRFEAPPSAGRQCQRYRERNKSCASSQL